MDIVQAIIQPLRYNTWYITDSLVVYDTFTRYDMGMR